MAFPPPRSPAFTLRPAEPGDYDALWRLKKLTMQTYVEQTWGAWDEETQEAFFRRNYRSDTVQVVMVDGKTAGLLEVTREPGEIFLANVQVHPDLQGRGLGTMLVRHVLEAAAMLQVPVRLQVLKVNAGARRLYARLGFVECGDTATHILMRHRPTSRARISGIA